MCCMAFVIRNSGDKSLQKINEYKNISSITWAYIAITECCTFNCKWCYASSNQEHDQNMPLDMYQKILKVLKKSGIKQITLGGGEPLQHPDFIEIVRLSTELGFITNINTNAFFLDNNLINKLLKFNVSQIAIDIESTFALEHDTIRGKQGSFNKAINAVDELKETNLNIVIQTVLTKNNLKNVLAVFRLAKDKNISKFRVLDLLPVGKAKALQNEVPRPLSKYMDIICKEAEKLGVKKFISYDPIFPITQTYSFETIKVNCPSRIGLMGQILVDGTMAYCASAMNIKLYNVLDYEDIRSIHKATIKRIKSQMTSNSCLSCNYYELCGGGCIARSNSLLTTDYSCPMNTEKIKKFYQYSSLQAA